MDEEEQRNSILRYIRSNLQTLFLSLFYSLLVLQCHYLKQRGSLENRRARGWGNTPKDLSQLSEIFFYTALPNFFFSFSWSFSSTRALYMGHRASSAWARFVFSVAWKCIAKCARQDEEEKEEEKKEDETEICISRNERKRKEKDGGIVDTGQLFRCAESNIEMRDRQREFSPTRRWCPCIYVYIYTWIKVYIY